jgi:UDP-glucose 6-dehydrogenase
MNKQELKSEAAVRFISQNINMNKRWNDTQIKKEDWKTAGRTLTTYIFGNKERTMGQITKFRESNTKKVMDIIRKIMMQIKQYKRNSETEFEKEISYYQCQLGMFALKIIRPVKNY